MPDTGVGPVNVVAGAIISQLSMLAIMFIGGLMIRRSDTVARDTGRPTFSTHAWLLLALTLLSFAMLGTSDVFSGVWAPLFK